MSLRKSIMRGTRALLDEYHLAKYSVKVCWDMRGTVERHCPICGYRGRFRAFGMPPRFDARCPQCESLERHRLLFRCNAEMHLFTPNTDVLHFAPESSVTAFVKPRVKSYKSADLGAGKADMQLNIEDLPLSEGCVDVVLASHVLEHVDDGKALREIHRVLRPNGRAILMFPLIEGWESTYENSSVVTEADRTLHFGQHDHVRYYGKDVRERIRAAGFRLDEYCASAPECLRFSIQRGERVFIASKDRLP